LTSKVIKAGKIVLIGSFISRGISALSSIVLARLLYADDYGALVLSAIIAGLITQIGSMGYEIYYLQFKGTEEEKQKVLGQVFNLRLVTNSLLFLIQSTVGLCIILLTKYKMSGGIILLLSFSLLFEGINAPNDTILKSKMDFRKVTIGNIIKELVSTFGKIGGAVLGIGGYCFGVGPILGSLARMGYLLKVQKYKHDYFNWDRSVAKGAFDFGKHNLLGSAGMYLVQQTDRILLNIFFSRNIVGQYGFAWSNAAAPFRYLVMPQQQLILTYITTFRAGNPMLFEKLLIIQRLIAVILFPLLAFNIYYTEDVVRILFSERWLNVVPMVRILLLYYSALSIIFPYNSLLTGLGFPQINARLVLIKAFTLIPLLILVAVLFKGQIIPYLVVFCIISISFDLIKSFIGIRKIGVDIVYALKHFSNEIILVLLLIAGYFVSRFAFVPYLNSVMFTVTILAYLGIIFIKDRIRTKDAIKIISKTNRFDFGSNKLNMRDPK